MTPDYAPGRRFEPVEKTLEDVDWVNYRPPSSFNQGWTDHPDIISPPTGPDMHSRLFYRNVLRLVDQLRMHLVSFTMVSYFHPPDLLDLHWRTSPKLRTLGFYFKQMIHDTNFSFDTPALRKFTLGVSSGPMNGHWKRLHQVITNNVLLNTVALNGFYIERVDKTALRALLGIPADPYTPDVVDYKPAWTPVPALNPGRSIDVLQISGRLHSVHGHPTSAEAIEDMLQQIQELKGIGAQPLSFRPHRIGNRSELQPLCQLKENWLREIE
jgi:hypothetical protein